jgi:MFS family permease
VRGFASALLLYFITGIGSGAANVPMTGLVSQWFGPRLRGRAAGLMVIGSGFAILVCGLLIPAINARWGPRAGVSAGECISATFIVTTLVQDLGLSESAAGGFWFWIGFLSLFSGPVFGLLSDRAGRRVALAAVIAVHAVAYLLLGLRLPGGLVYVSIALFGLAAWSVPGIMAAAVGHYLGPDQVVAGFGTITFVLGLGQILGPAAGGLAKASGSFASSYLMAAAK